MICYAIHFETRYVRLLFVLEMMLSCNTDQLGPSFHSKDQASRPSNFCFLQAVPCKMIYRTILNSVNGAKRFAIMHLKADETLELIIKLEKLRRSRNV